MKHSDTINSWVICISASLFFFYAAILMNMFNAFSAQLLNDLNINASQLGKFSSSYLFANVIFLIPSGMLLDRFSVRLILLSATTTAIILTLLLSVIDNFIQGLIINFVLGICASFCFIGPMKLVKSWFPANQTALITGAILSLAMLGGIMANVPLNWVAMHIGWRLSLIYIAIIGVFLLAVEWLFIKDHSEHNLVHHGREARHLISNNRQKHNLLQPTFSQVVKNKYIWLAGIYNSLLNLPLTLFGAVWGALYLTQVHHLTQLQAGTIIMMLFIGMALGSPFAGWLADRYLKKHQLLTINSGLSLFVILTVIFLSSSNFTILMLLFLFLGFLSGGQSVGYALVTDVCPKPIIGIALSLVSMLVMAGGTITQPLYGIILDAFWNGSMYNNVPIYPLKSYHFAMLIYVIGFMVSFIISFTFYDKKCTYE